MRTLVLRLLRLEAEAAAADAAAAGVHAAEDAAVEAAADDASAGRALTVLRAALCSRRAIMLHRCVALMGQPVSMLPRCVLPLV